MDKISIGKILNISDPFIMIDKITEIEPEKYAKALKFIDFDDWYIKCHHISNPVMPGTLQLESILQTFYILVFHKKKNSNLAYIYKSNITLIDKVKPGKTLNINTKIIEFKNNYYKGYGECTIDEKVVSKSKFVLFVSNKIS
jgi:3-hydroxymyristoyl/3-hydroxydecanoyl-(acyl carrier protein) dehydratases